MDPAEEEEGREKPPVIYTMENKPIVTCECPLLPGPGSGRCPLRARGKAGGGGCFWGAPAKQSACKGDLMAGFASTLLPPPPF